MKILCVGGGSGGHITPIAAVIDRLRSAKYRNKIEGDLDIVVWCDRKFYPQVRQLMADDIPVEVIAAGKLRRYANLKWWYRWFSPWHIIHTHIPNLIDSFKIMAGFVQSLYKLRKLSPDIVFCKGGYVSLPVGLVAHLYKIPLVIHDSDTVPGLTNRILSRYADAIGTGAPVENYPMYPKGITEFVGIPVKTLTRKINPQIRAKLCRELDLSPDQPIILVTGGGLGAKSLNNASRVIANRLARHNMQLVVIAGKGNDVGVPKRLQTNVKFIEFTDRLMAYMAISDLVVTRAGATTMAELAALSAPTIIVPSPYLAGDHQTKNAQVYEDAGAAIVLDEFTVNKNPEVLLNAIIKTMDDKALRQTMGQKLHVFARPNALNDMVDMIIEAARIKK